MASKKNGYRTLSRWLKRIVLTLLGVGLVAIIVAAWLPKPVPVELVRIVRGPLVVTVDEDGRARVKDRYVVSAPIAGNLSRIELHPGDTVKQGTTIANVVPLASPLLDSRSRTTTEARIAMAAAGQRQARTQIERVRSALDFAKADLERQRTLVQSGSISQVVFDKSELDVRTLSAELSSTEFGAKVAEYEVTMAQAAKGRLTGGARGEELLILSPVNGRVLRVLRDSEGAVQPGTPVIELGNPQSLEIVVDVLTSDATKIGPGALVRIERWGGNTLQGVVRLVEPSAFTRVSSLGIDEQRVNVVIDLRSPPNEWQTLGDGYRVEAHVVIWRAEQVLKIPSSAVFRRGEGWAAFAVRDGIVGLKLIELGHRNGLEVEVVKGLSEGDAVVTHPSDRVKDGVKIEAP
jgi:HlyD family secretion protein